MANYTRIGSYYPAKAFAASIDLKAEPCVAPPKSYRMAKRTFDLLLSGLLVAGVLSWLLPLLALCIKADSPGPVFFRQRRVGRNGRRFTCYKLRTMIANEEADSRPAQENDPRITRMGRWLRRTNIDELPQLFNVLAGSMSLVGPRPHMPADCRRFGSLVPEYDFRHYVKPGITGLAQVKGYHGPTPDMESILRRYHWDAVYVRKAGLWLDIRIMVGTLIRHRGL